MARKKKVEKEIAVETYRHDSAKRKNIPTAKMAGEGTIPKVQKAKYSYSPHLSPDLRFDSSGRSDRVAEIVEKAAYGEKFSNEEAEILRGVAANASQPWLEWTGKRGAQELEVLEVEPVALHIHERVSANAIIRAAKREDIQADLFADPQQEYKDAIQFYQHDVDWANRLILGDSLEVMSSLARREGLSGKVQMVYIDPPYGIKFASNFQSEVGKKDVKDKDSDLTREQEMVKAYRDTWHLGVHSYLSYLRDRLVVARELLADSGSVFVQISDENLHRVRQILDEVFGAENFVSIIGFAKTTSQTSSELAPVFDFLVWYARDRSQLKYRQLHVPRDPVRSIRTTYKKAMDGYGSIRNLRKTELEDPSSIPDEEIILSLGDMVSQSGSESTRQPFSWEGQEFRPRSGGWKTNSEGLRRLAGAFRLASSGTTLLYRRLFDDYPYTSLNNLWADTQLGGFLRGEQKLYVVQTAPLVVERCILMTTDPGDLVLDPTCGSGTSAISAEKWGRRWVMIDTSRVSLSATRQRLLTAKYDYYSVRGEHSDSISLESRSGVDPSSNFEYRTVPHITLGSIARNENLDPIFVEHDSILDAKLRAINDSLNDIDDDLRGLLVNKLGEKLQSEGLRAATSADCRRWLLPGTTKQQIQSGFSGKPRLKAKHISDHHSLVPPDGKFEHWHVPFDTDVDWPNTLSIAVIEYRKEWRSKMDDVNACIAANVEQEVLVDRPQVVENVVRVTGPFTVEGVRPEELSLDEDGKQFDPTPNEWGLDDGRSDFSQNASAYIDRMLQLFQKDGVTFPNNEHRRFAQFDRLEDTDSALHAEALWEGGETDQPCNIAIAFGPQYGPVTAEQVEDLIRASRRYDELVIAGFSFDGASQAVMQESENPRLKIHMAHIRPDASPGMDGLLKDSPKSQLFSVFGQPEIDVRLVDGSENGEIVVELLGVDIYSPLTGEITSSGANKVAAWFLDSDYDGRCFCITQAFFPNQNAWDKIAKSLGSTADLEALSAFNSTASVAFEPGKHKRIAVKVIDPRGNEVMAIRGVEGLS